MISWFDFVFNYLSAIIYGHTPLASVRLCSVALYNFSATLSEEKIRVFCLFTFLCDLSSEYQIFPLPLSLLILSSLNHLYLSYDRLPLLSLYSAFLLGNCNSVVAIDLLMVSWAFLPL